MLMLIFHLENDRYAINSSHIIEVIPRVILRKLHHAPEYVAGLFNYRGVVVPVIDLSYLIQGHPSHGTLSTRIIMINYTDAAAKVYRLGLMAEGVTDTLNWNKNQVVTTGFHTPETLYLGEIMMDEQGMIQQVLLEHLLSESQAAHLLPILES